MDEVSMTTLYSLGDSFMSVDDPDCGITSFLELYAHRRGFKHVSLARPGATNFTIRLQIDRAINEKADYVVIGVTSSDRVDLLSGDSQPLYTLDDVDYTKYPVKSKLVVGNCVSNIVSDTINNINDARYSTVTNAQMSALKTYVTYLHDMFLQSQKDYYIISDGLQRLQRAGIDYLLIPTWMNNHDWSWVKRIWPSNVPGPYDMPYGPGQWYSTPRFTNTHNPDYAHREFCNILDQLTLDWC